MSLPRWKERPSPIRQKSANLYVAADVYGVSAFTLFVHGQQLGRVFPCMSVIGVSELVEDEALLEIEATAVVPE